MNPLVIKQSIQEGTTEYGDVLYPEDAAAGDDEVMAAVEELSTQTTTEERWLIIFVSSILDSTLVILMHMTL